MEEHSTDIREPHDYNSFQTILNLVSGAKLWSLHDQMMGFEGRMKGNNDLL